MVIMLSQKRTGRNTVCLSQRTGHQGNRQPFALLAAADSPDMLRITARFRCSAAKIRNVPGCPAQVADRYRHRVNPLLHHLPLSALSGAFFFYSLMALPRNDNDSGFGNYASP